MNSTLRLLAAICDAEDGLIFGAAVPQALSSAALAHGVDQGQLAALVLEKLIERDRARAALAEEHAE